MESWRFRKHLQDTDFNLSWSLNLNAVLVCLLAWKTDSSENTYTIQFYFLLVLESECRVGLLACMENRQFRKHIQNTVLICPGH